MDDDQKEPTVLESSEKDKPDTFGHSQQQEADQMSLKHYFNIHPGDSTDNNKLNTIYQYIISQGAKTRGDVMLELRRLENRVGSPSVTQSRLEKIYHYVGLKIKANEIFKEMSAYERETQ